MYNLLCVLDVVYQEITSFSLKTGTIPTLCNSVVVNIRKCFQRKCFVFLNTLSPVLFKTLSALLWALVHNALGLSRFAFPFFTGTGGGIRACSALVNSFINASTGVWRVFPYMANLQSVTKDMY